MISGLGHRCRPQLWPVNYPVYERHGSPGLPSSLLLLLARNRFVNHDLLLGVPGRARISICLGFLVASLVTRHNDLVTNALDSRGGVPPSYPWDVDEIALSESIPLINSSTGNELVLEICGPRTAISGRSQPRNRSNRRY